jgi:cytochrome P450
MSVQNSSNTSSASLFGLTLSAGTIALSVTSLAVASFAAYAYQERRRYRNQCPIPLTCPEKCHFWLGHAKVFEGNKLDGLKVMTVDNADEDGLSCFYLFNNLVVGVTRAEHLKEIYQTTNQRIAKFAHDRHVIQLVGAKSLLVATGDEWKTNRHIMSKAFRWEYLKDMVPTINLTGERLAKALAQNTGKGVIDLFQLMKLATLEVIGATAFGYEFASLQPTEATGRNICLELAEGFQYLNEEFRRRQFDEPLSPLAQWYWLPTPANRKYRQCKDLWLNTMMEIIAARRKERAEGNNNFKDMLNELLDAHDDETNHAMDDATLTDNLITLLFAGFDTSSIALTYLFFVVAKYPDVEAKCLAEISKVLGEGMPTYEDLNTGLPYCMAVMQETLRLFPSVPTTTRTLVKPLTLSTESTSKVVTIPAGARILIPIWYVNRSPRNFSNPEEFIPDRFLPASEHNVNRYAHIPFSAGARDCVGRRFASLEMLAIFVIVVRKIRFDLLQPEYVPKPVTTGLVQGPLGGMPLYVRAR